MAVVLETSIGDITIDLYLKERPRCCLNFLKLCKLKKYNYNLFHTVEQNFIAQSGDPTGSGKGGESVFKVLYGDQATFFEAEVKPRIKHLKKGAISMVNNGSNMHGSQFFITLCENLDYLDNQLHTVFGEVSEGLEIVDKLNESITDKDHRPYQQIRIFHTVVLDDPLPDPPGLEQFIPLQSPSPLKEYTDKMFIGVDEEIVEDLGLNPEQIEERKKEKEAKTNAILLEMIGDLPDADIAPPDNVLFVCKLNSVTTSEDLEVIFSRFGPIESCEVIKDQKTGESLQYAFIEFKNEEDCEKAYFKMDNVLIDDRRIHVDFSQSVSKLKFPQNKKIEEKKSDEPVQPKFKIKDPDERKIGNYEYVFEDYDNVKHSDQTNNDKNKRKNTSPISQDKKHSNNKKYKTNSPEHSRKEYHIKKKKAKISPDSDDSRTKSHNSKHLNPRVNYKDHFRERSYKNDQIKFSNKKYLKNSYDQDESRERKHHRKTENCKDYNSYKSKVNKHSEEEHQNKLATFEDFKIKSKYISTSKDRDTSRNKEKFDSSRHNCISRYEKKNKKYSSNSESDSN